MRSLIWPKILPLALAALGVASAQSLTVYSEFTRVDPFGNVVKADRGSRDPREILSPALPRNAVSSYHLVVEGPPGAAFTLYIGLNPEKAVETRIYREVYTHQGDEWIPDALEKVELPYQGAISGVPGQTAQGFWVEFRVPRDSEPRRIKIEPQASFADRWAVYPMEARIIVTGAPSAIAPPQVATAPASLPADITARRVFKQKVCEKVEKSSAESALTIRDFIARDAAQDAAMASVVPRESLWQVIGVRDRTAWCATERPETEGPEWYLRLRDRIIGASR